MTVIDTLITDLQGSQYSLSDQNVICKIATLISALNFIAAGLAPSGNETANTFYAGPVSGPAAAPAFRAIDVLDLATPLGAGTLTAELLAAAGQLGWNGRAQMVSGADGIITLLNNALGSFTRLNLGGTSASFPALQRTAAALQAELADGSALANFICAQLQPSQTAGILGTTTNNSANAGSVGEFISSSVAVGGAIALTTAAPADITSIALTAGDWDVWGTILLLFNAATTITAIIGWTSATSGVRPAEPNNGGCFLEQFGAVTTGGQQTMPIGMQRFSLAAPGSIFLSTQVNFAVNTASAYGFIGARRVR